MQIMEKLRKKSGDVYNEEAVTIAFLGDSVTQGCFEIHPDGDGIGVVFDNEHAYHNCLCKILSYYYPKVPVNVIKAGISGDSAPGGAKRLQRDVLRFQPDLVVVCFGLNDVTQGLEGLENYRQALREIFTEVKRAGAELIFMTPNMLNTVISPLVPEGACKNVAVRTEKLQNTGIMDQYMEAARAVCRELDVKLCDCYKKWKLLEQNGVNTTALLSNHINHPTREMSWVFANALFETMLEVEG